MAKPSKKSSHEFGLQVADEPGLHFVLVDQGGAAAEVDGDDGEGFVHGQDEVAGAVDAFAVAEGLGEELAQDDADVFDGVVLIDVEVAGGLECQVEAAVLGEELQHVVEEADAGGDLVAALAFDPERAADLGFLGDRGRCWRFSCRQDSLQLVDVFDDGDGAFGCSRSTSSAWRGLSA